MTNKDNPHITDEQLQLFNQNALEDSLYMEFLEHITTCEYCAGLFADSLSMDMITNPSIDFKENTLNIIQKYEKRNLNCHSINFITYRLRVGFAMLGALLLIITCNFITIPSVPYTEYTPPSYEDYLENHNVKREYETKYFDFFNELSLKIRDFPSKIIPTEVYKNEETKK